MGTRGHKTGVAIWHLAQVDDQLDEMGDRLRSAQEHTHQRGNKGGSTYCSHSSTAVESDTSGQMHIAE